MPLQPSLASFGPPPHATREPTARPRLTVVWRREEPVSNRFALRDRIELLAWAAAARALGISRVLLQHPDPEDANHEVGDFALIYDSVSEWARWGVAREALGYLLWSPSNGNTLGYFPTLGAALAGIRTPAC